MNDKKNQKKKKEPKLSSKTAEARGLFVSSEPIIKLSKDMKKAATLMGLMEARYLVDAYYDYQHVRIATGHKVDRCQEAKEPTELLRWTHGNFDKIETDMKKILGVFASEYAVGQWLQSICGIADVLSAGFLTTFDIRERLLASCNCRDVDQDSKHGQGNRMMRPIGGSRKDGILRFRCTGRRGANEKDGEDEGAPTKDKSCKVTREVNIKDLTIDDGILIRPKTAGHWWNYAGLNPDIEWEKGKIRPWNARAKVFCFKAGESFVKVQNRDQDIYGHLYAERKQLETERNARGDFGKIALVCAEKVGKNTVAYQSYSKGKLPAAHIHSRARRYAVKIFLSHFHDVAYRDYYGAAPPVPYAFTKNCDGEHTHYIKPPRIDSDGKSLRHLYGEQ